MNTKDRLEMDFISMKSEVKFELHGLKKNFFRQIFVFQKNTMKIKLATQ